MTISDRVLVYLKENPGSPVEIGKALGLTKRDVIYDSFNWGKWSFDKAERDGVIEWKDGKWHLMEVEG